MKCFYLIVACALTAADTEEPSETCEKKCKREKNCVLPCTESPLPTNDTPQFVTLTFDDAVTSYLEDHYLRKLLYDRVNYDNCSVTASFYVPHPYTNYQVVNNLYNKGHDISLNSVSKGSVEYWQCASEEDIYYDYYDNSKIIENFAHIPSGRICGARIPNLLLMGDETFYAYQKNNIKYDSSCVVSSHNPLFPFTLDCPSHVDCFVGKLPKKSHPGIWVMPIISMIGKHNIQCNSLAACQIRGKPKEICDWLKKQFHRLYDDNRAPMTLLVNSGWLQSHKFNLDGLLLFLDYLQTLSDVFVVSHQEVLHWSANPVPLASYYRNVKTHSRSCHARTCPLSFRHQKWYFSICRKCPAEYPWIGNPEGQSYPYSRDVGL